MKHDSFQRGSVATAYSECPDEILLAGFVRSRNETCFEEIVKRHKRMVLGACQSVLHHQQDAEAAAQRTWLLLYQKAGSIHKRKSLQSWLHGAADRIARNMRISRIRREKHEVMAGEIGQIGQAIDELILYEEKDLVDAEVQHLPEKIRSCFMLCCLEGKSKREVAQELGLKEGTVASRVRRAREILRQRLKRLGITPRRN